MNINILRKQFSSLDMIYFLMSISVLYVLYVLHLFNERVGILTNNLITMQQEVHVLKKENIALKELILEKNNTIMQMLEEQAINKQTIAIPSSELLQINNEMTQFFIKTLGVIVVGLAVFYFINTAIPGMFSFKKLIPAKAYAFIQNNSPFLQERISYTYRDLPTNTDWIIDIINNRDVEMQAKFIESSDFSSVTSFIQKLQSDAGVLSTNVFAPTEVINTSYVNANITPEVITVAERASLVANLL